MVTQTSNHAPEQKTRRERRIEILQERRRIKKIVKKLRPVTLSQLYLQGRNARRSSAGLCVLGYTRFQHMNALQSDPGYQIIIGIRPFS